MTEKTVLLLDDHRGGYIPRDFVHNFDCSLWHVDPDDVEVLLAGPDHENYWETWDDVLSKAYFEDEGETYRLWQDGALFAYTGDGEQWI